MIEKMKNITFFTPYYKQTDLKYLIEYQFNYLLPTFPEFGKNRKKSVIQRFVVDTFNEQEGRKIELLKIICEHYHTKNEHKHVVFKDSYFTITTNKIHYPVKKGGSWIKSEPLSVLYTVSFAGKTWFTVELENDEV